MGTRHGHRATKHAAAAQIGLHCSLNAETVLRRSRWSKPASATQLTRLKETAASEPRQQELPHGDRAGRVGPRRLGQDLRTFTCTCPKCERVERHGIDSAVTEVWLEPLRAIRTRHGNAVTHDVRDGPMIPKPAEWPAGSRRRAILVARNQFRSSWQTSSGHRRRC
jgi:hypothetical protein